MQRADARETSLLEDWILQIKFVQLRDAGVYECQVSTEPRISTDFYLTVVGKMISGSSEMNICRLREILFWG